MSLSISQAFARLGAKPKNIRTSVSAFAEDGTLVLSLWEHYFERSADGVLPYVDRLSRWPGSPGNTLLGQHLREAHERNAQVRAIVAHTRNRAVVDAGEDASKIKKEFHILEGFTGEIVEFDGDNVVIHFKRGDRE